jgi:cytidine deaminase
MFEKLKKLHENSYAVYSNFRVSAIAVTKDGREFNGVNVENCAYPSGLCAERSAIVSAISNGVKKGEFKELNLLTSSPKTGTPCMACRQVILEFFDKDAIVRCFATTGEYKEYTVAELCPYAFDEDDLKI